MEQSGVWQLTLFLEVVMESLECISQCLSVFQGENDKTAMYLCIGTGKGLGFRWQACEEKSKSERRDVAAIHAKERKL